MQANQPIPSVAIIDGHPTVTSQAIAEHFNKRHDHVVRDIRRIIKQTPDNFSKPNFGFTPYLDSQGKERAAFTLRYDGFVILVMGYTGPEAMAMKVAYIEAFNAMRAELRGGFTLRPDGSPEALSTVKDRKPLNALINTWVSLAPLSYRDAWQQVKAAFGVENADGLTVSQIKPACEFVQARLDAVMAPAAGKVPQEIVTVIMKASHQNLAYQTTVNRLYFDVCQVLRELDNQLFADWKKLNDCFMSLTGRPVKAA